MKAHCHLSMIGSYPTQKSYSKLDYSTTTTIDDRGNILGHQQLHGFRHSTVHTALRSTLIYSQKRTRYVYILCSPQTKSSQIEERHEHVKLGERETHKQTTTEQQQG